MENPVKALIPSSVKVVVGALGCMLVVFAVADLLGYSGALLTPVTFLKGKFGPKSPQ